VRVAKTIGAIGRMMVRSGVLLLLFVAYQLWGTGVFTARAQNDLGRDFRAQLEQAGRPAAEPAGPGANGANGANGATPTTAPPVTAPEDLPIPEPGEPIGRIVIPDIGSDFYIVEGVDLRWLQDGPGHFPETPLPGQPGNAAIAGHRVTWQAPFNRIDELQPGAPITVETLQGTFNYEVLPQQGDGEPPRGHYIINPYQREILDDKGDNRITLMACHPKHSAAQRIVVEARLVSPPAPPTPRPPAPPPEEATELLAGGDPTAKVPAALFSLGAIAVWFATWLIAHRYRRWKWASYAAGVPMFAALLFFAFANINRLLPAAY
jgi:sortase A